MKKRESWKKKIILLFWEVFLKNRAVLKRIALKGNTLLIVKNDRKAVEKAALDKEVEDWWREKGIKI